MFGFCSIGSEGSRIKTMRTHQNLPDASRLSIVSATILLAYAVTPFIYLPARAFAIQLPGFFFQVQLPLTSVVSFIAAVLATAGADWLIQSHPRMGSQSRVPHWILPALTAWVIGVPLARLEVGPQWWVVFTLGGILFLVVLLSEYVVVDPIDVRSGPATIALTSVSFALFLVLATSVNASGLRLYGILAALVPAIFLVSLRTMFLRIGGQWYWGWALGIAMVVGEVAAGLNYWPISALRYGLLVLALSYSLTSAANHLVEGQKSWSAWSGPLAMFIILFGLAMLLPV